MRDAYDWTQFTVHMYYRAPRARVFAAWATSAGLASFFIATARHSASDGTVREPDDYAQAGDLYEWQWLHDFALSGQVLACVPEESVSYTFGGQMRIDVTITPHDDEQIEVRVHQTGCATKDPDRAWQHLNCRSCWVYFMTNLKSVLEHGLDLRDRDNGGLNDSVSIGWRPPA